MIAVVRCYKHITPVIVTVFEKNDEQTQKDALEMATILSRRDNIYFLIMHQVNYPFSILCEI